MKRFLWVAVVAVLFASCDTKEQKKALSAEETVERCWQRIDKGDWSGAVALMDVTEEEREFFVESLKEACEPLRELGTIAFETLELSQEGESATLTGRVTLADGTSSENSYHLIRRKGTWLISE